jgi:hypothetical protein
MSALSPIPFWSCDGRRVSLWYLSAGLRYTTFHTRLRRQHVGSAPTRCHYALGTVVLSAEHRFPYLTVAAELPLAGRFPQALAWRLQFCEHVFDHGLSHCPPSAENAEHAPRALGESFCQEGETSETFVERHALVPAGVPDKTRSVCGIHPRRPPHCPRRPCRASPAGVRDARKVHSGMRHAVRMLRRRGYVCVRHGRKLSV